MTFSERITAVDAHAGGEPGRVIVAGVPDVPGATMFDKMVYLRDHNDRSAEADASRAARVPGRELQRAAPADPTRRPTPAS